jgi:ABC-type Fe3+ transport system substrate-binding protein
MRRRGLSRREFLRITGAAGASAIVSSGAKSFGVPAFVKRIGDADLSDPKQVGEALKAEGAEVMIKSWGFSGLPESTFIPQFAKYTETLYGVPVKLQWYQGDFGKKMTELPLAGKTIADEGVDVIDTEEDSHAKILALEWTEPVNLPQYMPLLPLLKDVEEPYILHEPDQAKDGADIHGVIYQGYEWLQAILRKDKVDVAQYKDWTDLSRDEMKKKGINYAFNDGRGHFVFMGILNSLIKQGIVKGELWSQEAWEAGITWWKDHLEDKVLVLGDIGNDPTMRLKLQSGEAWWAGLWGVYTRELLGTDWNKKDDVLAPFYPTSGIAADREVLRAVKGAKHPVAARILINWFITTEFQHVGWYKEKPYCGGVMPAHREVMPDWAKPYYPADPGKLILPINWQWYTPQTEWISKTYDRIVRGA